MPERIAIYPGSFDPPTLGHFDLIKRAAKIFDHLIVAVARNDAKTSLFTVEERMDLLRGLVRGVEGVTVSHFHGLTVDFARQQGAVALIRGLRVVSDFEFELTMAINNHKLNPEVDTVALMPSEPFLFLSSRLVREIATYGGKVSHYLTPEIEARLLAKLRDEN
jgi:pantetheine-phosphate adenylyltransferase